MLTVLVLSGMNFEELANELDGTMHLLFKNRPQKKMTEFLHGEMFVLHYLEKTGTAVLPKDISAAAGVSTARIAAILNSLESKGFVNRQSCKDDNRQVLVNLTVRGREAGLKHSEGRLKFVAEMLKNLGEHDAKEYVRIMGKMAGFCNINNEGKKC